MVRWLNIIVITFYGLFINCIAYIQHREYQRLIRVAILTDADSVIITGTKDNQYLENYTLRTPDSLPLFLKPYNGRVIVNAKPYYGYLEIRRINNKIWVINILSIEDYLKGVVPCEIGKINRSLIESAKAQAIAARTYAYAHLNQFEKSGFDLYATERDQVYGGIQVEDTLINEAILKTRGLILTYKKKPVDAKYHSTCGGNTADFSDAWSGNPITYLRSVKCGFCNESPHYYWEKRMTKQDFFSNLRKNLFKIGISIPDTELIRGFRFKRNSINTRIIETKIITDSNVYVVPAYNIRRIFGSEKDPGGLLKSSNFTVEFKADSVIIKGKGFGHGVGMCQFGAMGMAKIGKKYVAILKHYYPGTNIVRFQPGNL
ncbi:MAG: SpoIID/LytB domain-containing protein [candidate division WOR-3 bacterium]